MRPIQTRPVLSMNFYQQPQQQNHWSQYSGYQQFGLLPYKEMMERARYENYYKQFRKKQEVKTTVKNIQDILEGLLSSEQEDKLGNDMERTAKFNEVQSQVIPNKKQKGKAKTKDKKPDEKKTGYHFQKQYFQGIRNKLSKINQMIDNISQD